MGPFGASIARPPVPADPLTPLATDPLTSFRGAHLRRPPCPAVLLRVGGALCLTAPNTGLATQPGLGKQPGEGDELLLARKVILGKICPRHLRMGKGHRRKGDRRIGAQEQKKARAARTTNQLNKMATGCTRTSPLPASRRRAPKRVESPLQLRQVCHSHHTTGACVWLLVPL